MARTRATELGGTSLNFALDIHRSVDTSIVLSITT